VSVTDFVLRPYDSHNSSVVVVSVNSVNSKYTVLLFALTPEQWIEVNSEEITLERSNFWALVDRFTLGADYTIKTHPLSTFMTTAGSNIEATTSGVITRKIRSSPGDYCAVVFPLLYSTFHPVSNTTGVRTSLQTLRCIDVLLEEGTFSGFLVFLVNLEATSFSLLTSETLETVVKLVSYYQL